MKSVGIEKQIHVKRNQAKRLSATRNCLRAAALLVMLFAAGCFVEGTLRVQAATGTSRAVEDMQLISPGTGWALANGRLYWTSDNGQNWDDITPGNTQQAVSKAFFLDANSGWAVFAGGDGAGAPLSVASTHNGGRSWQNARVALGSIAKSRPVGGVASLYFADAQQGWLVLDLSSSSNFSAGAAFHTADGGLTWTVLPAPPAAGKIVFLSSRDGWMAGGPAQDQLWFTHDGGDSWHLATLPAQAGCTGSPAIFDLPFFTTRSRGQVTTSTVTSAGNCAADYETQDGGKSWQVQQTRHDSANARAASAHTATQTSHLYASGATLFIEQEGVRRQGALPQGLQPNGFIAHAEFVDASRGWLNYSTGTCLRAKTYCTQQSELLTTVDGGKSYSTITPRAAAASQEPSVASSGSIDLNLQWNGAPAPMAVAGSGAVISNSSGFDLACAPALSSMQTWWTDSPYQDVGIYLGGCDVYCVAPHGPDMCNASQSSTTTKTVDSNLTPAWLTNVTKMGWGILPIWVGPQSPCIANASSYWTINNSDTYSTGTYQADLAIAQANALGISDGIIYYDMEGYTPDGGSCSAAVEAFLVAWTSELHANGFASGLYGGITDFETDFLALSPEPDAAWIAAWDSNNTVWNIGSLSNSYWPNNQRIHQWNSETNGETWGGINLGGIDQNVVDAPVVGNWLANSPTFSLSNSGSITISTLGSNGTSTISVTPSSGFTGVVNLSCTIATSAAIPPTCSIPSSVTITGATAATATLTIKTTAPTSTMNSPANHFLSGGGGTILACLLILGIPRRSRSWRRFIAVFILALSIGTIAACGGGGNTTSGGGGTSVGGTTLGSYTVTVLGVDQATGAIKSSTVATATVN